MIFKLKTSKETMQYFEEIGATFRLQPFALSKLAIAISIKSGKPLEETDFKTNTDGLELNRQTITGEYDELFKALFVNHAQRPLTDDEYFPTYMKAHLDRGAAMLFSEFKYSGSKFYQHLIRLDQSL